MKKNTSDRKPERRKPVKAEQQAKRNAAADMSRQRTHNQLVDSYNSIVAIHETMVGQLEHAASVTKIVTHPEVKDHLTPKVLTELNKSLKVVTDGITEERDQLKQLVSELNPLCPDPMKIPKGDDAADRNMEILTLGGRYGSVLEHHEQVTAPAVRTCVDLVNSVLPENKKVNMHEFNAEHAAAQASLDEELKDVN